MSLLSNISKLDDRRKAWLALWLILPAPLIGIIASLYLPPVGELQVGQAVWFIMKVWLILMPVLWILYIEQKRLSFSKTNRQGIIAGCFWAIPVGGIILGVYGLFGNALIDDQGIKGQIEQLGLANPVTFWSFAMAISFGNALMEEYVWRWFVFTRCKTIAGVWGGILLSALFFTMHHVIVIWNFGDASLIVLASVGIFGGGTIWAWLYHRYSSIWPGYISHVVADLAIMFVAWEILSA